MSRRFMKTTPQKAQTEPVVMVQNLLWTEAKGSHPSLSHHYCNL